MSDVIADFRRDTRGVAVIFFAIMSTVICLTIGTDVDHFCNTLDPSELQDASRGIATNLGSVSLVR